MGSACVFPRRIDSAKSPHSRGFRVFARNDTHIRVTFAITLFILVIAVAPAQAQSVASTPRGIVVAHDHRIELMNGWNVDGVAAPGTIVVGDDRVAVLDPLNDEAVVVVNGTATRIRTGATPLEGAFIGRELYILERDARALERIGADGARASVSVAADPAFLRVAGGRLYVYSRTAGVLQEITPSPFAVSRRVRVAPFASAFAVSSRAETRDPLRAGDAGDAYFVYPREAKLRMVALGTMQPAGEIAVGAVPVDVAIASSSALTASTLAIADPSAKRVWMIEGRETTSQAFARGFLRGLLGLGLSPARDSQFPTGIDRVLIAGKLWLAWDSSSGTLYRFTKSKSSVVAQNVGPHAFTARRDGIYVWDATVRRLHRFAADE